MPQINNFKRGKRAGHQWFMPVILATQEGEFSRMTVQS
jgi:hypothetical protein